MSDLIQILESREPDPAIPLTADAEQDVLPVSFVPTPTPQYNNESSRRRRAASQPSHVQPVMMLVEDGMSLADVAAEEDAAGPVPIPIPVPLPLLFGSRALIFKQDPSVTEIGIRKVLLRGAVLPGPRNSRIVLKGVAPVAPNALNDFIQPPGTEGFDAVHTFAVVLQALTMCQRALGSAIKWQWNGPANLDPINVFPRAGETMNAFYSRTEQALKFFFFTKPGSPPGSPKVFTCRSFDIAAHETGHAILDSLKPNWILNGNVPQTGALHEAFGDLLAVFLTLSQLDQVEALIVQTKGNLHNKTFLSDMGEEFGLALGRPNGLRNADNDLKMSQVTNQVHNLSQVFTGGVYDVMADIFVFERNVAKEDEAATLLRVGQYVFSLLLRAIQAAPASNATFASVVNQMLQIAFNDGKPVAYRNFIRNRFTFREVVVSPTPLAANKHQDMKEVKHAHLATPAGALQDRAGCCGTMKLREYRGIEKVFDAELAELQAGIGGTETAEHDRIAAE